MIIDPFRLYRRHRRLVREAEEEAQFLRRRHGPSALQAARSRLDRPDLTHWGKRVMQRAIRLLEKGA
ncbi:hypothetical protein [Phenylobacterium deserti]|nr:hypothetical protein [Phenylobacterium deserti]